MCGLFILQAFFQPQKSYVKQKTSVILFNLKKFFKKIVICILSIMLFSLIQIY